MQPLLVNHLNNPINIASPQFTPLVLVRECNHNRAPLHPNHLAVVATAPVHVEVRVLKILLALTFRARDPDQEVRPIDHPLLCKVAPLAHRPFLPDHPIALANLCVSLAKSHRHVEVRLHLLLEAMRPMRRQFR